MGGVCWCCSWTYRPLWLLLIPLLTLPSGVVQSESESPAAVVGKMYPITRRGNHWAVGHLMGKKSIEVPPAELQETDRLFLLTASETVAALQPLMEALTRQRNSRQTKPQSADRPLHSRWREEDTDKYLRQMSGLLLQLAWKDRGDDPV